MTPFDAPDTAAPNTAGPDTAGRDTPLFSRPAMPDPAGDDACRRDLRDRFLRAGRDAVDDRELLVLLLSGAQAPGRAELLAANLLETFGTPARVLAAGADRLRTVDGLDEAGICAIKTAEALGIRLARAVLPEPLQPLLNNYRKVIDYCRTLAGHRPIEEFHLLFVNRRNLLIHDERHQTGTVTHAPVYPREICRRALEVNATALILVHNHPGGNPNPSNADIETTKQIGKALKTIDVTLLDHIIVTSSAEFSFKGMGLL